MKTLYFDCSMGAAGDMITGALTELIDNKNSFIREVNSIGIKGVRVAARTETKCGIEGTRISVRIGDIEEGDMGAHHHADQPPQDPNTRPSRRHRHRTLKDIEEIVSNLRVSEKVRSDVMAIYTMIAEAESKAHGKSVSDVHFHEVGSRDAITDITMTAMLMERIAPHRVVASPINVGSGQIATSHGVLPVPAPATVQLLRGVPIYNGKIKTELCTPTGAALLKYYVTEFGDMPVIKTEKSGFGMGKKDLEAANCLRVILGETSDRTADVSELCCNIDDMTAEELAYATQCFLAQGALDVYTVPIVMKKSRPAHMLCVMCDSEDKDKFITLIFKHTSTIGIREYYSKRYLLKRRTEKENSPFGEIEKKISEGYGVIKTKYEFDDLSNIADRYNISITDVLKQLKG